MDRGRSRTFTGTKVKERTKALSLDLLVFALDKRQCKVKYHFNVFMLFISRRLDAEQTESLRNASVHGEETTTDGMT